MRRTGADALLAQFMASNPDMTPSSKLAAQGAKQLSLKALFKESGQLVIPDRPLWMARRLETGVAPYFPAAVLGCIRAGGRPSGLLIQVGTSPDKLHWREAFVTRAPDIRASMVLVPMQTAADFCLAVLPMGPASAPQGLIAGKLFGPLKDLAVHLRAGDGVLMRTQWSAGSGPGARSVDLCLPARYERRTERELVFSAAWAPPCADGGSLRWPPDMLGVLDGLTGELQASRVFVLDAGPPPRYEFYLDLGKAKCGFAFDANMVGKPAPVAPAQGTRLTMDELHPTRRGEPLRVDGKACTFVEHGKKANQIKVQFPDGVTTVDVTRRRVELG
ncbi:MAG: hypothetical protein AB7P37_10325 [Ramlibacter sp.]